MRVRFGRSFAVDFHPNGPPDTTTNVRRIGSCRLSPALSLTPGRLVVDVPAADGGGIAPTRFRANLAGTAHSVVVDRGHHLPGEKP